MRTVSLLLTLSLLAVLPITAFATGLNAILTVDQPTGSYYEPGDQFIATLVLTDDDGNTLFVNQPDQSGIVHVSLWLSGPRHDYHSLAPYDGLEIVGYDSGYDPDAGFDPETGQITITLPNDLPGGSGSYTVLFKVQRVFGDEWFSVYPDEIIPVNQIRPTFSQAERYISCSPCHGGLNHHGTDDLADCLVCHAQNRDDIAFSVFYHNIHDSGNRWHCSNCHTASSGINDLAATACYTCHNMPGGHGNYSDSQCANCHQGNNSVYNRHDEPSPNRPATFSLVAPDDGWVIEPEETITFEWNSTTDSDDDDEIVYYLEVATDDNFENVTLYPAEGETGLTLGEFEDQVTYYWRVWASDLNSSGRHSTDERSFSVDADPVDSNGKLLPSAFTISTPYPNPFNPSASVSVNLPEASYLKVTVFDLEGREVASIADGIFSAGMHQLRFNASRMPSGLYFFRAEADAEVKTVKAVLIK